MNLYGLAAVTTFGSCGGEALLCPWGGNPVGRISVKDVRYELISRIVLMGRVLCGYDVSLVLMQGMMQNAYCCIKMLFRQALIKYRKKI